MSFYENQHRARRKTSLLVGYFLAAVILIVVAVNLATFIAITLTGARGMTLVYWIHSPLSWWIALGTLGAIVLGSLFRIAQLGKGGLSVALMAGGIPVDPNTQNLQERTLINVTEEMAIASGTRAPRIFVMRNEPGINAFVAGTEPSNTVLAVTQGTLDTLNREELQGVIGHEFSHILNGDMRMNVRLIGILAGILLIGQVGEFLLRGQRFNMSRDRKGQSQLALVGLALMVVGYVGLFFGRLIKAAISRQREFLADASAVQFTRNPDGIAGALYAIGQHTGESRLMNRHAEDMSHMCFGETLKIGMAGLLATHPPIEERIKAIDPGLIPRLKARYRQRMQAGAAGEVTSSPDSMASPSAPGASASGFAAAAAVTDAQLNASAIKASVGRPTPEHVDYAQQVHSAIPEALQQAAHDPQQAEALLYASLLLGMSSHGQESMQLISRDVNLECAKTSAELYKILKTTEPYVRLPLLDITLATLKTVAATTQNRVIATARQLIEIDNKITLSEFICSFLIRQALNPPKKPLRSIKSFSALESSLAILFSAIVQSSGESAELQARNFNQIMASYSRSDFSAYLKTIPTPTQMTHALDQLNRLTPLLKQPVIDACVDCVLHDHQATLRELEVLRAVCEVLECPMPPIQATSLSV